MHLETNNLPYSIIPIGNKWRLYSNPSKAFLYFKNLKHNLITGEKTSISTEEFLNSIFESVEKPNRILSLSYEAGFLFNKGIDLIPDDAWLALDITYESESLTVPLRYHRLSLEKVVAPSFEEYKIAFDKGYQSLERGDSYQFNLTFPFEYKYVGDFLNLASNLFRNPDHQGEFAHATYCPSLEWGILSNSPECLFNQRGNILETKPIKGTVKDEAGAWKKMAASEKDKAELFMITDLLRNDLNKIEAKAKVLKLRVPLKVPGLLHQYSHIELKSEKKIELDQAIKALFPGGSITGAPKIRTMQILSELEQRLRGAYCGSTLFFSRDETKASINIRTAEVFTAKNTFTYGAGGGVTLLSKASSEYEEMLAKVDSFTLVLQPDTV
ncbi:MAG: anthranilate/para-aminobenzoate synthase component I [Bacteriovoracaceae bacterium]|jgi:anthranilate/para-aminobenzoate synthase component I